MSEACVKGEPEYGFPFFDVYATNQLNRLKYIMLIVQHCE